MTDENGFGNDGPEPAASGEPNDTGDQMNEKDEDLTHSVGCYQSFKDRGIGPIFVIRHPQDKWRLSCGLAVDTYEEHAR